MTKKEENKKTEKKIKKISQKSSNKKSEFWVALQSQLLDFGTLALKKGIANMAIAKIDDTEEKKAVVLFGPLSLIPEPLISRGIIYAYDLSNKIQTQKNSSMI